MARKRKACRSRKSGRFTFKGACRAFKKTLVKIGKPVIR
jgi:hypothetical protein